MKQFIFIQGISLRVVLLFGVAVFGTLLTDYLTSIEWFGDYYESAHRSIRDVKQYGYIQNEQILKWSARHCWYVWMFALLFLLQLASLVWYVIITIQRDFIDSPNK